MRFTPSTEFLRPYVEAAHGIVPLETLMALKCFTVPLSKKPRTDGLTHALANGRKYINIRLFGNAKGKHTPRPYYEVLWTLAHELAHLREWNHNPEFWRIEALIKRRFTKVLTKNGIKDLYSPIPLTKD